MRKYCPVRFPLLACGLSSVLTGCSGGTSPPSRFYTLAPLETHSSHLSTGRNVLMALGPVSLPDYLNRRQIVTRSGDAVSLRSASTRQRDQGSSDCPANPPGHRGAIRPFSSLLWR